MDNFNYDSYCGIYCGACDIMIAYKTGKRTRLSKFWNESTVRKFHKSCGIPYDESRPYSTKCTGCKTGTLFVNCSTCRIRRCAMNSRIEHCTDCKLYPCSLFAEFKKVEQLLPHVRDNHSNLESIKKDGVKKWLSDQEKKWQCPGCGEGFSWYSKRCSKCRTNLEERTFTFSFMHRVILKLGIILAKRKEG